MVSVMSLWLPILVSAVAVFFLSSIVHMFLGYHKNDFAPLPNEDAVMNALRPLNIPPGEYLFPRANGMAEMKSEAFQAKWKAGPVGMLTALPNTSFGMGKQLLNWFIYVLVMTIFAAYVASRAAGPGAEYLTVFRFVGTTAFIAYAGAIWQQTVWYHHSVRTSLVQTFDGLLYALVTAGIFGTFWP